MDQCHALLESLGGQLSALQRNFVVFTNLCQATIQRYGLRVKNNHRYAGIGEAHRDATAHGPGADNRYLMDIAYGGIGIDTGLLRYFSLGKKYVAK
ncbi:hypothetical protein D3C80_1768440 [compost metagenome]